MSEHLHGSENDSSYHILLVENDPSIAALFAKLLRIRGCEVVTAIDGLEALEAWRENSFDLILMDLQMPQLNGFETTRIIREQEGSSGTHIPIIAMTAHSREEDQEPSRKAGMDGYLSKLTCMESLYDVVRQYILNSRHPAAGD